ncbi:MAG: hypothetical protein AAGJ87_09885 [Pseudomonadota bacterium]
MTSTRFWICIALWTLAFPLAASPAGAVVGFIEGIAIAFFIAPILWATGAMETAFVKAYPHTPLYAASAVASVVTLFALAGARRGWADWRAGRFDRARFLLARAYRTAVIPWALILCALSVSQHWG